MSTQVYPSSGGGERGISNIRGGGKGTPKHVDMGTFVYFFLHTLHSVHRRGGTHGHGHTPGIVLTHTGPSNGETLYWFSGNCIVILVCSMTTRILLIRFLLRI